MNNSIIFYHQILGYIQTVLNFQQNGSYLKIRNINYSQLSHNVSVSIRVSIIQEMGVLVLVYGCYLQPSLHTTRNKIPALNPQVFYTKNYGKPNLTTNLNLISHRRSAKQKDEP